MFNIENSNEEIRDTENLEYVYVEYNGDISGAVSKISGVKVAIIDNYRAVLVAFSRDIDDAIDQLGDIITYKSPEIIYTLCSISPIEAAGVRKFYSNEYLSLEGSEVIVGIIDTGIDYLNEEFMNEDETSRIISIFDQTDDSGKKIDNQPTGSEFSKEDINKAIKAKKEGGNPYLIVPSKDEIGHGTNMAGIIGAKGANPELKGAAPKCDLAIVKLVTIDERMRDEFGAYGDVPAYINASLFLGISYLFKLSIKLLKPIVIFLPLGSNFGPHDGSASLERYIDEISKRRGVVVVVPTGNEGEGDTHTSGEIAKQGDISSIEIKVGKEQKNLRVEIWITKPDKFSISIVSPSGEIVSKIPTELNKPTEINFIYEQTKMFIEYTLSDISSGDERIIVNARNIREGIWIIKLIGDFVLTGKYDVWLPQKEMLAPDTRFIRPNSYITLTTPSTSQEVISVSYYNQNYKSIEEKSGKGYTRDNQIKPDITAGGVNALTTAVGGGTKIISGSSVAAAVVAGCTALILEWGIIKGNDREMYAANVKTYLIRGTSKREGDIYPNPEWGYGIIDMEKVFNNMRGLEYRESAETAEDEMINYFQEAQNRNFLVEYEGDIVSAAKKFPNTSVYIIDEKRAILSVPFDKATKIIKSMPGLIHVDPGAIYTLCDISPIEASQATLFHNNVYLPLDGSGVIIGMIDTGIDYLNEEFINDDDTSRILAIWDHSIKGPVIASAEYTKEEIDKAIKAKRKGEDPYAIVPSKDEIGHGTNMAGILAAKGTKSGFIGVAPKSDLVVVKLNPATKITREYYGIYGNNVAYRDPTIFLALRYLYEFASKLNRPIVIYLPFGTNNGAHNGDSIIEGYIDEISTVSGVVVVVPTGNQGDSKTHTSGVIKNKGDTAIINLKIGKNQRDIYLEIWISKPDKVALSITSPTGEVVKREALVNVDVVDIAFIYEETKMTIAYSIPEEITGEERILIVARNIKEGIWQFKLTGVLIVTGKYDAWISQRELLAPETKFINPSPDITLTVPSTSDSAISVAYYNQNNNSIIAESGRGYTRKDQIKPDIAAGGINQITTSVGGGTEVVSGSSVAGAVVAGCCALILQWGIVDGNEATMFPSEIKTYLTRGTNKRPGDVYPNPQWGYGMLDMKGVFDNIRGLEKKDRREISPQKKTNYFLEESNRAILIQYKGDIVSAIKKYPNTDVYIIDNKRAAIAIPYNQVDKILKSTPEIVYADVEASSAYTLCDISPVEVSGASMFHNNVYMPLDGSGVIIGIADTGIDYLNEEFINEDDTSKILAIWDQTIQGDSSKSNLISGIEYTKEEIDKAIKEKKNGGDPYAIVPSRDEIGHGTNMAGILTARGANPELVGVAPGSSLVVVKLRPISKIIAEDFGIYGNTVSYRGIGIFLAIRYLYEFAARLKKPIVIYIPLGTNNGAHNGESYIARYINEVSTFNGVAVVFPTGNQGNSDTHTSGVIKNAGDIATIELKIGKNQKNIRFEIWFYRPDKVSLSITSPTGENIERIVPKIKEVADVTFIYEETNMQIEFSIPEEMTGEEKITIFARNIKEGIWKFSLIGDLITVGKYDAWLQQKELLAPGTGFLNPTTSTTLTVPSTTERAISVAYYNQNNNSIIPDSGNGYTRKNIIKPDIAAGGINQLTTDVGGGTKVVSGSSVAAAVTAGCCALIFQWGIIEGNDPSMYASKVKTYLIRGTNKRPRDIYPNPQWGYGMLDLKGVFDNIRSLGDSSDNLKETLYKEDENEYYIGNLFIRLPRL